MGSPRKGRKIKRADFAHCGEGKKITDLVQTRQASLEVVKGRVENGLFQEGGELALFHFRA